MNNKSKKTFFENINHLSKGEREAWIGLLYRLINVELNEPIEDIDMDFIYEFFDIISALTPDEVSLSEDEIDRRLAEFKKKAQTLQ